MLFSEHRYRIALLTDLADLLHVEPAAQACRLLYARLHLSWVTRSGLLLSHLPQGVCCFRVVPAVADEHHGVLLRVLKQGHTSRLALEIMFNCVSGTDACLGLRVLNRGHTSCLTLEIMFHCVNATGACLGFHVLYQRHMSHLALEIMFNCISGTDACLCLCVLN